MERSKHLAFLKSNAFKLILLLFGFVTIGMSVAITLHELGHAVTMWVMGGQVERITINPLSWSFTYYASAPLFPVVTSGAGVVMGTVFAVLLLLIAGLIRNQYLLLLLMITNVLAAAQNGLYLLIDSLLLIGGDATNLIAHGVSKTVLIGSGALLVGSGVLLAVFAFKFVGFRPDDSLLKRTLVLEAGVLPYFVAMVVYQAVFNIEEIVLFGSSAFAAAILVLIVAVLSHISPERRPTVNMLDSVGWRLTWMTVIGGIALVVVELLLLN